MALATRCPNCHALFRVAADQLKLRGGMVRCGACRHVFDATGTLSYIDDATLPASAHAAAPAVGAVIAAIRKAESAASESLSTHGLALLPPAPVAAGTAGGLPRPGVDSVAGVPTEVAAAVAADASAEQEATVAAPIEAEEEGAALAVAAASETAQEHRGAGAPTTTDAAAADEGQPIAEAAAPAFLREADAEKKRRRTVLFGIGALLLAIVLLAQLATAFRSEILATFPQTRPALTGLCKVFRCTVGWPARGDLLAVVGSELQALPGTSAFELTAVVRNRGNVTLALPAIELTLSDTLNRTVARKVFSPSDYLAGERDAQAQLLAGLAAGADLTVRITFEARGLNAAGFVVYPFYL
jgi:predicted Zn finger-like uncharacterized protein